MLLTTDGGELSRAGKAEGVSTVQPSQPMITPLLDALAVFREAPEGASDDPAWADVQVGIVQQAQRLATDHPDSPAALARLAQALQNADRLDEAAEAARSALSLATTAGHGEDSLGPDAAATYVASSVLAAQGHLDDAEQALALRADDGIHRLLWAAIAAERDDVVAAMKRLDGVQGADAQSLLGWLLLRQGKPAPAIKAFRSAIGAGAPSPAVLINLAYAYASLGSVRKAIRSAQQAVALAPASRSMSHNLVGHLLNGGYLDEAERELDRLTDLLLREDADSVLLRATVALRSGTDDDALRVLRRGRSQLKPDANRRAYAELLGNLAYFEWKTGNSTRDQAIGAIRRVARRAGGISVAIVCLLADMLNTTDAASEIRDEIDQAANWHDRDALLPAMAREARLSADFDRELTTARDWAKAHPLDGSAAAAYVHLLGQVEGEYAEAGDEGLRALRRTPHSTSLRNNTAYVLAMAGRGPEALDVINPIRDEGFVPLATEGLALLAAGRIVEGCRKYHESVKAIEEIGDVEQVARLKALVGHNMRLAAAWLGIEHDVSGCDGWLPSASPIGWASDPEFLLIRRAEARLRADAH